MPAGGLIVNWMVPFVPAGEVRVWATSLWGDRARPPPAGFLSLSPPRPLNTSGCGRLCSRRSWTKLCSTSWTTPGDWCHSLCPPREVSQRFALRDLCCGWVTRESPGRTCLRLLSLFSQGVRSSKLFALRLRQPEWNEASTLKVFLQIWSVIVDIRAEKWKAWLTDNNSH